MSPTLTKIPWKQPRRASSYSDSSQFDLSFGKNVEWESLPPDPFSSHLQPYHIPEESPLCACGPPAAQAPSVHTVKATTWAQVHRPVVVSTLKIDSMRKSMPALESALRSLRVGNCGGMAPWPCGLLTFRKRWSLRRARAKPSEAQVLGKRSLLPGSQDKSLGSWVKFEPHDT